MNFMNHLQDSNQVQEVSTIYANVLELDENGDVLNAKYAEKRATDYIRAYCDSSFEVNPPYEDWEIELYSPPPREDLV